MPRPPSPASLSAMPRGSPAPAEHDAGLDGEATLEDRLRIVNRVRRSLAGEAASSEGPGPRGDGAAGAGAAQDLTSSPDTAAAGASRLLMTRLRSLIRVRDQGFISREEFAEERARILRKL